MLVPFSLFQTGSDLILRFSQGNVHLRRIWGYFACCCCDLLSDVRRDAPRVTQALVCITSALSPNSTLTDCVNLFFAQFWGRNLQNPP